MNKLEELVGMLPKLYQDKVYKKECHMSDGYCESLDIVGYYIEDLRASAEKLESDLEKAENKLDEIRMNGDY